MISTVTVSTAAPTKDLTVLATAKAELGTTDADDAALAEAIRQASDEISAYCGRPRGFGRETLVETFVGVRAGCLILSASTAPTISSIVVDGETLATTDYMLTGGGLLYRLSSGFVVKWCANQVTVTYSAGYTLLTDLPRDIERCCLDLVAHIWHGKGQDATIRSYESPDVETITYMDADKMAMTEGIPDHIAKRLDPYRVVVL